jgi:hypothetical protein
VSELLLLLVVAVLGGGGSGGGGGDRCVLIWVLNVEFMSLRFVTLRWCQSFLYHSTAFFALWSSIFSDSIRDPFPVPLLLLLPLLWRPCLHATEDERRTALAEQRLDTMASAASVQLERRAVRASMQRELASRDAEVPIDSTRSPV